MTTYQSCEKKNAGLIDEVWLWGGPYFGYWESNLAGPDAFWYNSRPTSGTICQKLLPIMGFNYERGEAEALESFGHRTESTMRYVYGSWTQDESHLWNRFALLDKDVPGHGGCGNSHYPVNATSNYDRANTRTVTSSCEDYLNYPNLTGAKQNINCSSWDCTITGYLKWWYTHMPKAGGIGPDGKLNNWWIYISDPENVLPPSVGQFSNLSANLSGNSATLYFTFSNSSSSYIVDMSTLSDMSHDVYLNFGVGISSPTIVSDPQTKWDKYSCGRTLYWRVYNSDRTAKSSIVTNTINCNAVPPVTKTYPPGRRLPPAPVINPLLPKTWR